MKKQSHLKPGMTVVIDPKYVHEYDQHVQPFNMFKLNLTATVIEVNAPINHPEHGWSGMETAHIKQGVIGCFSVPTKWLIPAEQRLG